MEKISWKQVRHNERHGAIPNLRWGHSCCVVDDEVVYFGGYADSNYMNDVWSFNTITMEWTEIQTLGDVPSQRSNCSMNYDKDNQRIIVFGGGGANKRRFNTINILDWKTKEWLEIHPKPNEPSPWERTYHSAQFYYPYLVVYGGEGVGDLDDLWIFNFLTLSWTEVALPKNATRPCARRFHSSAKLGNQFYVIAGCYSKYRCLSDIYSIDLTKFFETGKIDNLCWRQRKMKDNTFLTRWGHTSTVLDQKIYVFGGRFCNDLNDILVLDPSKNQINTLKIQGQAPKARRRHSACFLGSSLLIFGGFNGEYFNDLHYINISNSRKKIPVWSNITLQNINELKKIKSIQWKSIKTNQNHDFNICQGLIAQRFSNINNLDDFLTDIDGKYSNESLQELILTMYRGYGKLQSQLVFKFNINICESKQQLQNQTKRGITQQERDVICTSKRFRTVEPVIVLQNQRYMEFLEERRNSEGFYDFSFCLNDQEFFHANRAIISLNSSYFSSILTTHYQQKVDIVNLPINQSLMFQTILYYLTTNFIVVCKDAGYDFWIKLAQLAQYFSLQNMLEICQNQMLNKINQFSSQELLVAGLELNLTQLSMACAQQIIKNMVKQDKDETGDIFPELSSELMCYKRQKVLKQVYSLLRFDILQRKIDSQQQQARNSLKKISSDNNQYQQDEKENFQLNL